MTWSGDVLNFNARSPMLVALLGSISQTMATYMSGQALLGQLFANKLSADAVATEVRAPCPLSQS